MSDTENTQEIPDDVVKEMSDAFDHVRDIYIMLAVEFVATRSIVKRAEAAESRAADLAEQVGQLQDAQKLADHHFDLAIKQRDTARYEAMMEASRAVYDVAQVYREAGDTQEYSALIHAFNKIVTSKAANP